MNKYLKNALLITLLIALVSTVSYCSAPYDTETAKLITIRKSVSGEGYILRNETPVERHSKGVFEASAKDGERVSGGKSVGVAISGKNNDSLVLELEAITKRIEEIKKSDDFSDIYASDEARIFSALRDITKEIRTNAQNGNFTLASQNTAQLKTLLEKKYSPESKSAAQELLAELEEEKERLEVQLGGVRENVISPASGYFYTSLDGLERIIKEKEVFAISTSEISSFSKTLKDFKKPANTVGKVVDTYSWYLVANIPTEEAEPLKKGMSISLYIEENPPVSATVEAVNPNKHGQCAIVIKCTRDVREIFEKRTVSFEICYEEYHGLYVPSAAIRVRDDVTGVYVINRNETVSFRAIDIILQDEDFYIAREGFVPPENVPYSSLKLYDDILVNPEVVNDNEVTE